MPTIYDVAARASVSAATVSRVMNQRGNVRPDMASRVLEAIEALDYRPNGMARNLRRQTSEVWALIVSDIDAVHFTSLSRGVMGVSEAVGRSVVLYNTDDDLAKERRATELAIANRVGGVVISPASGRGTDLEPLIDRGIPVVTVDRRVDDVPVSSVMVENAAGAEQATAHLFASGYRRVACVNGPPQLSSFVQRLAGYRRALAVVGAQYDPALVITADAREGGGYAAVRALLALDEPPDAVFVTNSLMTLGALECLADQGVRIPGGMGIVGFDEHPWARLLRPSLTTVAQPTYELGRQAAELLVVQAGAPGEAPVEVLLPTQLLVRESSVRSA